MIVGTKQVNTRLQKALQVAYVDGTGQIAIKKIPVPKYYKYTKCTENDPDREKKHVNFMDASPIKKVDSYYYTDIEQREYLTRLIPQKDRDEIFQFKLPNMYSVDIEIDMSDPQVLKNKGVFIPKGVPLTKLIGFPDPENAYRPIESISITSPTLETVVLTTSGNRLKEGDNATIQQWIKEYFGKFDIPKEIIEKYTPNNEIKYSSIVVNNERELIIKYLKLVKQLLHSVIGWNWDMFDSMYIRNRCRYLGINMAIASPINEVDKKTGLPKFRSEYDYMEITDKFGGGYWKLSKALGFVSQQVLGVSKVDYTGSFIDLYNGDYRRFCFYNAVDTILVMMIHLRYDYISPLIALAFYAKIPIANSQSVTAISSALWFDELYSSGVINTNDIPPDDHGISFVGGYVMTPRRMIGEWVNIVDYKSLYPSSIRTLNCSTEAIVGRIDLKDSKAFADAKAKGYTISMNGTLYKNDGINVLNRIVTRLVEERYHFKRNRLEIDEQIKEPLRNEIGRRKKLDIKIAN